MSSIKIIKASQATHIYRYKNIKRKILKCCASIYFNKRCLKHNLTPSYSRINITNTSPAATYTQHKICKLRIKVTRKRSLYVNNIIKVVSDDYLYINIVNTHTTGCPLSKRFILLLHTVKEFHDIRYTLCHGFTLPNVQPLSGIKRVFVERKSCIGQKQLKRYGFILQQLT